MAGARWLADPSGAHELRYWDGTSWTEHVSDRGTTGQDPLTARFPPPGTVPPPGTYGAPVAPPVTPPLIPQPAAPPEGTTAQADLVE